MLCMRIRIQFNIYINSIYFLTYVYSEFAIVPARALPGPKINIFKFKLSFFIKLELALLSSCLPTFSKIM